MDSEFINNKLNIKSLLFTKAIQNYTFPVTEGHKVYSCTDCGDRYIMESSYDYHINRKSVKITYKCQHCGEVKIFFNRCNLLSHIRSHAFKTATINVSDLKVEPMPLEFYSKVIQTSSTSKEVSTGIIKNKSTKGQVNSKMICYECKKDNAITGIAYKDRAKHYMQYTKVLHSCPICMFTLPTVCALKAHLRIHVNTPPYYCPECGITLPVKSIQYPYSHDCEGFKMMRATARVKCPIEDCQLFHPNEYKEHIKTLHLKKIYKCPTCVVAFFKEDNIQSHLINSHYSLGNMVKPTVLYQCDLCSGKLVLQSRIDNHMKIHFNHYVYPCWVCGTIFKEITMLISHHMCKHSQEINISKQLYSSILNEEKSLYNGRFKNDHSQKKLNNSKLNINIPNCYSGPKSKKIAASNLNKPHIICHLCENRIPQNWKVIKNHYANYHKMHKCVDIKIILKKLSINECQLRNQEVIKSKYLLMKRISHIMSSNNSDNNNIAIDQSTFEHNQYVCVRCGQSNDNKELLELHMSSHKDPYMAYQCLECGQSFAVKPSFSTHLLLEHEISDATDYISNKKQCFNEHALIKGLPKTNNEEPIKVNQCQICRDQFEDSSSLEKHFRIHGMAFLLKNTIKNTVQE